MKTKALVLSGLCVAAFAACGGTENPFTPVAEDAGVSETGSLFGDPDACNGLECQKPVCNNGAKTTIRGTVFDPAGKNPLYNVIVYVPNSALPDIAEGASCDRCGTISNKAFAVSLTDAAGNFVLEDVPAGNNIPIVMQVGKWRRQVTLPRVEPCQETVVADKNLTRLPKNRSEGHIPRIALTTGGADPLECLLRKVGIEDSEFGTSGSEARVHLFAGSGYNDGTTDRKASTSFASGGAFSSATSLWNDVAELKKYDVVLMGCEGSDNPSTKPIPANLYTYASQGGRVFASHWHEYWFAAGPPEVKAVGAWTDLRPDPTPQSGIEGTVNVSFPKGQALKTWLGNVNALTSSGKLMIKESKHNLDSVDTTKGTSWITVPNVNVAGNPEVVQYLTFNAPIGASDAEVCGRSVFSDLHVSSGDGVGQPFPSGCVTQDLSPQEKALEFMLFDLSSCVQRDSDAPVIR